MLSPALECTLVGREVCVVALLPHTRLNGSSPSAAPSPLLPPRRSPVWQAMRQRLSASLPVQVSSQRMFGAFVLLNLDDLSAELAAMEGDLSVIRASVYFGGVMVQYEEFEALLAWVSGVVRSAGYVQRQWLFFAQLFAGADAREVLGAGYVGWQKLSGLWKRLTMEIKNGKDAGAITAVAALLQVRRSGRWVGGDGENGHRGVDTNGAPGLLGLWKRLTMDIRSGRDAGAITAVAALLQV